MYLKILQMVSIRYHRSKDNFLQAMNHLTEIQLNHLTMINLEMGVFLAVTLWVRLKLLGTACLK